jgi:hypothetical protein
MKKSMKEICDALDSVCKRLTKDDSSKTWTDAIKKALLVVGKRKKYDVGVSKNINGRDFDEWLYDMIWLKQIQNGKEDYPFPIKVPFIMESEWANQNYKVLEDFDKLLICKADIKLLVHQRNSDVLDFIKLATSRWHENKGTYLIARYIGEENRFEYTVI